MRKTGEEFLSNSILHVQNEKWQETIISKATLIDLKNLTSNWLFDWQKAFQQSSVYKLATVETPDYVEGLMSLEEKKDFYFVPLIENAPFNRGQHKVFKGIPSNLFAFACKLSEEQGFGGFVTFEAKSALIKHYETTLGAMVIGRTNRMFIDEKQAQALIQFHFPKK